MIINKHIDTNPILTFITPFSHTMTSLDNYEPIEEIVLPLSVYFFSSINKAIIKGRSKKRKIDQS